MFLRDKGHHPQPFINEHRGEAYWCGHRECWSFVVDCPHLVEPLEVPAFKTQSSIVTEVRWANGVLQLTMNTGERFQYFKVPRRVAVEMCRNPGKHELWRAYRFERVRGRG